MAIRKKERKQERRGEEGKGEVLYKLIQGDFQNTLLSAYSKV